MQRIRTLEREKEKFVLEANETATKYQQALQQVSFRDSAILDLQIRITGSDSFVTLWSQSETRNLIYCSWAQRLVTSMLEPIQ